MIQGLLLAAGRSRRFGTDKRWATVSGRPMALHSALQCRAALAQVLVVLRGEDAELAALLLQAGMAFTHCPESARGMGHSLAHGVRHTAQAAGWVIGLADMPLLRPASIAAVAQAVAAGRIVVPQHLGQRGHPVGFDRAFGPDLMALQGDSGARGVLKAHPHAVQALELDDPGVLLDVDLPEQLPR